MSPIFYRSPAPPLPQLDSEPRLHRRLFSRLGWVMVWLFWGSVLVQNIFAFLLALAAPGALEIDWVSWAVSTLAQYGVVFPIGALVLSTLPAAGGPGERAPLPLKNWVLALAVSLGVLFLTNLCTLALISLLDALRGAQSANPLESVVSSLPTPLAMVSTCLLAPIWEEAIFRGLLLRRLEPYGPRFAALASALCFSLMHGNLYQIFYTFVLGLVFAWVALRTGRVWQAVLLHACVNFLGGGFLTQLFGDGAVTGVLLLYLASVVVLATLFAFQRERLLLPRGEDGLSEGQKWRLFLLNPGMLLFLLTAAVLTALLFLQF